MESVTKIIINDTINLFSKTALSILLISNHSSFRMLFDKIAFVYFILTVYYYFSIGTGQPREPALCQLYRHTFVPYKRFEATSRGRADVTRRACRVLRVVSTQIALTRRLIESIIVFNDVLSDAFRRRGYRRCLAANKFQSRERRIIK